jgi:hypothetical protein
MKTLEEAWREHGVDEDRKPHDLFIAGWAAAMEECTKRIDLMRDTPYSFIVARQSIEKLLDQGERYTWHGLEKGVTPPLHSPCIVACADYERAKGVRLPDYSTRTLAFAKRVGGSVCWFGVKARHHDIEELRDVAFYVPLHIGA